MVSISNFIARTLLVTVFIYCGITKFQETTTSEKQLIQTYNMTKTHLNKHTGVSIPLSLDFFQSNGHIVVQASAVFELLSAALVVINIKLGGCLLCTYLLLTVPFIHCPFFYTGQEQVTHIIQLLKNVCLFGGLLVYLSSGSSKPVNVVHDKKKKE